MESIRRAQLIVPFGVGALHTLKGGVTVITAGLDYWFVRSTNARYPDLQEGQWDEFRITKDQRFIRDRLGVDFLMTPPDYRIARKGANEGVSHPLLSVPVFRFPRWHICERCGFMEEASLIRLGKVHCGCCETKGIPRVAMRQTRFVAVCASGHIMDFPWREWVFQKHTQALTPDEMEALLHYTSGSSSRHIVITAHTHDRAKQLCSRSIGPAFGAPNGVTGETPLSRNLTRQKNDFFLCRGQRPWLMDEGGQDGCSCGMHISPTLINASNAYFGEVRSSLFIPPPKLGQQSGLRELYQRVHAPGIVASNISLLIELLNGNLELVTNMIMKKHGTSLGCTEQDLMQVLQSDQPPEEAASAEVQPTFQDETFFRLQEYGVLSDPIDMKELKTAKARGEFTVQRLKQTILDVVLVERLMETRALVGFSRLEPDISEDLVAKRELLRKSESRPGRSWLPAIEVFGEGIFIRLNAETLAAWEGRPEVQARANSLQRQYNKLGRVPKVISPRFVLIHTFSHVLISQIAYDCGYSSSSLRERLYVCADTNQHMAGVLIYTADGDSDGTLGGLVRLGHVDRLEPILVKALEKARWCSSDPVCFEAEFQGQNNCNKAACHNCCIISETCCEEMNRFLDRGLLIGTLESPGLGYFQLT
jgi:hypothetical protein